MPRTSRLAAIPTALILVAEALILAMTLSITPWKFEGPSTDSSVFRYVALTMSKGGMPYLDSFDHKGPVVYLINLLGLKIHFWRGLWPLEFACLLAALVCVYRLAREFASPLGAHVATLVSASLMQVSLEGGNLVEEWALPFVALATWQLLRSVKNDRVGLVEALLAGISLGVVLMLRPNMIATWVVLCPAALLFHIREHGAASVLVPTLVFVAGVCLVVVPLVVWLAVRGAFAAFVDDYLVFNMHYTGNSKGMLKGLLVRMKTLLFFMNNPVVIIALIVSALKAAKRNRHGVICCLLLAASLVFISVSGREYKHYAVVIVPSVAACLALVPAAISPRTSRAGLPLVPLAAASAVACVLAMQVLPAWMDMASEAVGQYGEEPEDPVVPAKIWEAADIVKQYTDEDDLITVCNNSDVVYLASGRMSASTYSYQAPIGYIDETIMDEYYADLDKNKPAAVVLVSYFFDMDRMREYLDDHGYRIVAETSEGWATVWLRGTVSGQVRLSG